MAKVLGDLLRIDLERRPGRPQRAPVTATKIIHPRPISEYHLPASLLSNYQGLSLTCTYKAFHGLGCLAEQVQREGES
jgi:hypothetical protein